MPKMTVSRSFKFSAAHRLVGHEGKCQYLHGHNFVATVGLTGKINPATGMIVDYQAIKQTIGCWIENNWDHNIILDRKDPLLLFFDDVTNLFKEAKQKVFGREPFVMEVSPTSENMAIELANFSSMLLSQQQFPGVSVSFVRIEETEACHATLIGAANDS